jgi:hypothetical protein
LEKKEMLEFIGRLSLSIALSCVVSLALSMGVTFLLFTIAHAFEWNYKGDIYWIFNVSIVTLVLSWIVSFGYFMSVIK